MAGSLRAGGLEHDLLIVLAVEHFRALHRLLHFGAIFIGLVLVDHAQRPRIHVYFNCSMGAGPIRSRVRRVSGGVAFELLVLNASLLGLTLSKLRRSAAAAAVAALPPNATTPETARRCTVAATPTPPFRIPVSIASCATKRK